MAAFASADCVTWTASFVTIGSSTAANGVYTITYVEDRRALPVKARIQCAADLIRIRRARKPHPLVSVVRVVRPMPPLKRFVCAFKFNRKQPVKDLRNKRRARLQKLREV